MNPIAEDILMHYGVKRRSGRYPWGSGENPYQHGGDFLARVEELEAMGKSQKEIAEELKMSTTDLRMQVRVAKHERRALQAERAKSLREEGKTLDEIAKIMGYNNDSSVRALLNENTASNKNKALATAEALKKELAVKGALDVGEGVEQQLGVSKGVLQEALFILETEGYNRYGVGVPQVNDPKKRTITPVISVPDIEQRDAYQNLDIIKSVGDYHSSDGGASWDKVAAGANYLAGADKQVAVNAQFVTIYGVEWDWTSSGPTKGKRTDGAAGFGDPNPAVNNGSGSSPFDDLYPWKDMTKVTRTGGVMVKEPKYWFKWTKTGKKLKLQIADGPVEGFHVDPVNMDRGDGLGELDLSYIARYHCASGTYKSETNKAQQVSITRSTARTQIHNLGANIWQFDFAQMWYVNMLFLVEFADWNGERIGRGCSANNSKENNGRTDAMQYHTGTTAANRDSYGFCQYRNIEGWWDNVYDWMDGCYYNSNGLNVIKNPAQFHDSANGVLVGLPVSGYPKDFAIPTQSGLEWALYPSEAGGSTTTYVPDYWDFNGGYPCLRHGGGYSQSQNHGPFYVSYDSASDTSSYIGCRLQERPPKAA